MKKKITISVLFILIIVFLGFILSYKLLFADNINDNPSKKQHIFLIHTGSSYSNVLAALKKQHVIKNMETFKLVAKKLQYDEHIKPGRYLIDNNTGNLFLIRKLRSGNQDPVRITFNNIQNKEQLAERISMQIEATKAELLEEFNNPHFLDSLNLTEDNFPTIFLANTYEFYWNTSAKQFIERMLKEYNKFWTEKRISKAQAIGLSPTDVTILASIIQKESNHYDEYPVIAGVYLNRIKIGMPLQADPTVLYALKKLGISRRVLNADLKIQSPYNTYINKGLPPGPICLPELKSIEETLNAEEHNYLYFCAREDFSGYSNFAETWEQHLENARKYQKVLNERDIH
ncbi:MAG TPA: endolytic transglycosylase MltG [Chitinophagales bacterium]|nr:endolytic transglycosylase MltG [Chitinophagales bacterium]